MGTPVVPTSDSKAATPVSVRGATAARLARDRMTVRQDVPIPPNVAQALHEAWGCPDCDSEVRISNVGIAHDDTCPKMRGAT